MKPFAIFGGIVVVGLAVIFAGLRLTDHSASANALPTPLTHAQFVRAGNAICDRGYREEALNKSQPKTVKAITRSLRRGMPSWTRTVADFRALVPPPSDASTYARLLGRLGQMDHDVHALLHAFETGQVRRGVLIARQAGHLGKRLDSLSRKLGLNICGLTHRQVKKRYG